MTSELATHLAAGTAGLSETIVVPTGVPQRMQSLAQRIVDDHRAMSVQYQVDYVSPMNQAGTKVEVRVARPGGHHPGLVPAVLLSTVVPSCETSYP